MSSYQKLKKDLEAIKEENLKRQREAIIYYDALWEISSLTGPGLLKAPEIATKALMKALYETK